MTDRTSASAPASHIVPPSRKKPSMRVPIGGGVVGGATGGGALRGFVTRP